MNILERWFNDFKDYPRLSLQEAKKKYEEYVTIQDEILKKEKFEEIFFGTMHVIYKYIKNNCLQNFEARTIDVEDIINGFVEEWIRIIKDGRLYKTSNYTTVFLHPNITNIKQCIISTDNYPSNKEYTKAAFIDALDVFINLKNKGEEISLQKLYMILIDVNEDNKPTRLSYLYQGCYLNERLLEIFERIYTSLQDKKTGIVKIAKTKLDDLYDILLEFDQVEKLNSSIPDSRDLEEELVIKKLGADLAEYIKTLSLSEKAKDVLFRSVGLYGDVETLTEISESYHQSRGRAAEINKMTVARIRHNQTCREFNPDK